ncbi:hypothetical protein [Aureimonas psammosilenae]|uniref:hypothetical protein n=1 Tax=Aureimonas psammosilenae TaxID=2495496 RepID=UPI0012606738|nr:hypothetical protein [Aureimonas psammosilenae]
MDFVLYGVLASAIAVPSALFVSACMAGARLLDATEAMSGDCAGSLAAPRAKLERSRNRTSDPMQAIGSRLRIVANDHGFSGASTDASLR